MKPIAETKNFLWASNRFITLAKIQKNYLQQYTNLTTKLHSCTVLLFYAPLPMSEIHNVVYKIGSWQTNPSNLSTVCHWQSHAEPRQANKAN